MSLIGPRPALPSEVVQFDARLASRHDVRPGVTGLWQVEERDNGSFEAYRRLDLYYVENWSLLLDLTILLHTVPAVIGRGWRALRPADGSAVTTLAATPVAVTLEPVDVATELIAVVTGVGPSPAQTVRQLPTPNQSQSHAQSTICRYGVRAGSKCEARPGESRRSPGAGVVRPTPPGDHARQAVSRSHRTEHSALRTA